MPFRWAVDQRMLQVRAWRNIFRSVHWSAANNILPGNINQHHRRIDIRVHDGNIFSIHTGIYKQAIAANNIERNIARNLIYRNRIIIKG